MSVPCAGRLGHHVAGRVDHIGVVAGAAAHGVVAGAAVQHVVAGAAAEHVVAAVAGQRVVEGVAGGVDGAGAGQRQVLDVGAERVADARLHRVGAFAWPLPSPCRRAASDHVGVVAGAADHGVVAGAAVEHVVAGVAGERVVERVAGGVDVAGAGQRQVLDIGAERVADAGSAPCRCPALAASVTMSPAASTT